MAAAIVRDGRVLAAHRREPRGWEFPGGKIESGETPEAALVRECQEELAVTIRPLTLLGSAGDGSVDVQLWQAELIDGIPVAVADHDELRWVGRDELDLLDWLPIDRELAANLAGGMNVDTISFDSHGTSCAAWHLPAETDELATAQGKPCVVMAHGFGGTRDTGLLPFAQRFAAAGCEVVVFDYRGFGTSDGVPRQDVHHRTHREDYHSAIAAARAMPGVDPSRIALWGSSYSGGHVVAVAAKDPRVAAVISQGAAMDGAKALLMQRANAGTVAVLKLTGHALRDIARMLLGHRAHLVPIVGPPGSSAVISSPGADAGYNAITGPSFRNEMCARGILRIPLNRPVTMAAKVRAPILLVVAEQDNVAPPAAVRAVAAKAPRAETESYAAGHFDIYVGEFFEKSVARQVEFLQTHLGR